MPISAVRKSPLCGANEGGWLGQVSRQQEYLQVEKVVFRGKEIIAARKHEIHGNKTYIALINGFLIVFDIATDSIRPSLTPPGLLRSAGLIDQQISSPPFGLDNTTQAYLERYWEGQEFVVELSTYYHVLNEYLKFMHQIGKHSSVDANTRLTIATKLVEYFFLNSPLKFAPLMFGHLASYLLKVKMSEVEEDIRYELVGLVYDLLTKYLINFDNLELIYPSVSDNALRAIDNAMRIINTLGLDEREALVDNVIFIAVENMNDKINYSEVFGAFDVNLVRLLSDDAFRVMRSLAIRDFAFRFNPNDIIYVRDIPFEEEDGWLAQKLAAHIKQYNKSKGQALAYPDRFSGIFSNYMHLLN